MIERIGLEGIVSGEVFRHRRILMMTHEFSRGGGVATYMRSAVEALQSTGLTVDVLVRPYWPQTANIELIRGGNVTLLTTQDVQSTIRNHAYDVVHVSSLPFTPQFGFPSLEVLGLSRFPLVYTAHSSMAQEMERLGFDDENYRKSLRAQMQLLRDADIVIAPSYSLGTVLEDDTTGKICVVPNPVTLPSHDSTRVAAIATWVRQHYAPHGEELLVYSGRVSMEKGVYMLAHAYNLLKKRRRNLRVLFVGSGMATPSVLQILGSDQDGFIRDGNGNKYQPVTDWKQGEDLLAYYEAADAVILPSRMESFGLSAAEALLMRRPLIASDIDGLREHFVHPGFAYGIEDPNDVLTIVDAVTHCLGQRRTDHQQAMIERAVTHIDREFSLHAFSHRMRHAYAAAIQASTFRRRYHDAIIIPGHPSLEELLREDPTNGALLYQQGMHYLRQGQLEDAELTLERAKRAVFRYGYNVEQQDVYLALTMLAYRKKDYHRVHSLLVEGTSLPSHDKVLRYQKEVVQELYQLGCKARTQRNYSLAADYFRSALLIDPTNGNAHHRLAQTIRESRLGTEELRGHYEAAFTYRASMFPQEFETGFGTEAHRISGPTRTFDNEITTYAFGTPRLLSPLPGVRRAIIGYVEKRVIVTGSLQPTAIRRSQQEHSVLEQLALHPAFQEEFKTPIPLAHDGQGTIIMEQVQGRNIVELIAEDRRRFQGYLTKIACFGRSLHTLSRVPTGTMTLDQDPRYLRLLEQVRRDAEVYGRTSEYALIRRFMERGSGIATGDTFYFIHGDQSPAVYYSTGRELYCIDFNNSGHGLPAFDAALVISNASVHLADYVPHREFTSGISQFIATYTQNMTHDERALFLRQLPYYLVGVEFQKARDIGLPRVVKNIKERYGITLV